MQRGEPTSDNITPDSPSLTGMVVLCVDDDADNGDLLKVILEIAGAVVLPASSAQAALEILKQLRPHVLIADLRMPGEDGFELIRKVRMLPPEQGGRIPAMALTAYIYPEDRLRALESGFQAYMTKPIEIIELIKAVAHLRNQATAGA